ncbi:MAG: NAD(P)-binding domain-containing protein [Taibaiella sp.]|nr:NAD(P)-binding domain-containing protein [Taibaiella sp.]
MKKIGIIGSGVVAQSLGSGLIKHGYEVLLGSRDAGKLEAWKEKAGKGAHIGSFEDAAMYSDVLILAVKGSAAADAVEAAGPQNMVGKTVLDTTNPIADAPPDNGVLKFFTSLNESLMEQLQARFPEVHFIKAFNSVGNAFMCDPQFKDGKPTMFICGNNDGARNTAKELIEELGWDVSDMGKAAAARAIEPLCMLWCIPGMLRNEWNHAFKLVKA